MNKQIEEIAKLSHKGCGNCEDCPWKDKGTEDADCISHYVAAMLYNAGYRKSADVVAEVLEILSELKENYLADDDVREACAISYAEIKIAELKKKYESEGADDE